MKELPKVNLSFAPLTHLLYAGVPARALLTGIELRVFSQLREPRTAESLAAAIGTHPENTRFFLDALAANELLTKREDKYVNTPLADTFLVEGEATYVGDVLRADMEWMQPAMESMVALVKDGPSASSRPRQAIPPAVEAEVYASGQRAGIAQHAAAMVRQLPEFGRMQRMLDLGCGGGLIGLAIVAAHPTMTGVLFDRPAIAKVAQRFVEEYEMQDRVTVVGGDYKADPIGEGYDLVWTSYTLHREILDAIIAKIHAALRPGGVYISFAESLSHERTRPAALINGMLSVSLRCGYTMFDEGEIAAAMLRAGFRSVHSRAAGGPQHYGSGVIDVGRK